MTDYVLSGLQNLLTELGATAAVISKQMPGTSEALVLATAPSDLLPPGSPFPLVRTVVSGLAIERDPELMGTIVPTSLRLFLPSGHSRYFFLTGPTPTTGGWSVAPGSVHRVGCFFRHRAPDRCQRGDHVGAGGSGGAEG